MSDGAVANISAQRNEDWLREFRFKYDDTHGLDITAWTFVLRVRSPAGFPPITILVISDTATGNGSRIRKSVPTDGAIEVLLTQEDLQALPGRAADIARFPFNLVATDETGLSRADLHGLLIVEPGVGVIGNRYLVTDTGEFLVTDLPGEYLGY